MDSPDPAPAVEVQWRVSKGVAHGTINGRETFCGAPCNRTGRRREPLCRTCAAAARAGTQ